MKSTIRVSEIKDFLNFGSGNITLDAEKGTVGCVEYNRAPPRDLFIVIKRDGHNLKVINPRLMIRGDQIVFGQDSSWKSRDWSYKCDCHQGQGYSGCDCGKSVLGEYQHTFVAVSDDYEYMVHDFTLMDKWYVSYLRVQKENLKYLDVPLVV